MGEAVKRRFYIFLFYFFRLFPLQDKVVATSFRGRKYGDNPQFILQAIRDKYPNVQLFWLRHKDVSFEVPSYMSVLPYARGIKTIYHLATSKVYIDTHEFPVWLRKRKGQIFIQTWHGGLGIKKLEGDVDAFKNLKWLNVAVKHTNALADVFLSQSDHLSNIYRSAFNFQGPIWKVGYPKSDVLFKKDTGVREKVLEYYNIPSEDKVLLYAPTFRSYFYDKIDVSVYDVDFDRLKKSLQNRFGSNWHILTRWHPMFGKEIGELNRNSTSSIDVTAYADVQELVMACDAVLSDYSSIIFDAALREIPCFTFATDFEAYKADRGVYYEMEELPFAYARNNDELEKNILNFDNDAFLRSWDAFKIKTGLYETGHVSQDVADKIIQFFETGRFLIS